MSGYWDVTALASGLLIISITVMRARRNTKLIRDILLLVLAPTMLFIAIMEIIVVPIWGAEAVTSLGSFWFICWLIPVIILTNHRHKY